MTPHPITFAYCNRFELARGRRRISGKHFVVNLGAPIGMAVDPIAGKLYWTHFAGPLPTGIHRFNLADGSNQETLFVANNPQVPRAIALHLTHGKMYWTELEISGELGSIRRANLEGSDVEDLITTGIEFPRGITLHVPETVPSLAGY